MLERTLLVHDLPEDWKAPFRERLDSQLRGSGTAEKSLAHRWPVDQDQQFRSGVETGRTTEGSITLDAIERRNEFTACARRAAQRSEPLSAWSTSVTDSRSSESGATACADHTRTTCGSMWSANRSIYLRNSCSVSQTGSITSPSMPARPYSSIFL
jgi:hypothetical protein